MIARPTSSSLQSPGWCLAASLGQVIVWCSTGTLWGRGTPALGRGQSNTTRPVHLGYWQNWKRKHCPQTFSFVSQLPIMCSIWCWRVTLDDGAALPDQGPLPGLPVGRRHGPLLLLDQVLLVLRQHQAVLNLTIWFKQYFFSNINIFPYDIPNIFKIK